MDSTVHRLRTVFQRTFSQRNFEDPPSYRWPEWARWSTLLKSVSSHRRIKDASRSKINLSVYRFGDIVAGVGDDWRSARQVVATGKPYKLSLLHSYLTLRDKTAGRRAVDLILLGNLCRRGWVDYIPDENIVVHMGSNEVDSVAAERAVQCITKAGVL